jgi:hypothetical protein
MLGLYVLKILNVIFELWHRVVRCVIINILEEHAASELLVTTYKTTSGVTCSYFADYITL